MSTFALRMWTILICIFGTMMDNRILGYFISRSENEEGGRHTPFDTQLHMTKCSVLYPLPTYSQYSLQSFSNISKSFVLLARGVKTPLCFL